MASLYELTQQAAELYGLLSNDEIDDQTFNDTIEAMGTEDKVQDYCRVIKQLQADSDMFAAEIKRLTERKKTADNSVDRMKGALLAYMQASGQPKLKAGTFAVAVSNSQAVNILDENAIPTDFITLTPEIEKAKIKEQLKQGVEIPGAELVTNTGVRIR